MNRIFLVCALIIVAVTSNIIESSRALAAGPARCPAFTSEMVDAAAMAYGLGPWVTGTAGDDPATPSLFCHIEGIPDPIRFEVEVNYSDDNAFVIGRGLAEDIPNLDTRLFSIAEELTLSEKHACRAAVQNSFVWRNYCVQLLP